MLANLKKDIPAGIVVFLVALPLCLGIALASGAPLFSGVISGIIGGIVVGLISRSDISVSGPAAGLAAVVLAAITKLGSFELFLTALLLAGIFQLILGLTKAGFIADFIPSNVIKGLLAAIGILLILKQIPHALGYDKDYEGDFNFFQPDGENTFSELWQALNYFTPGAVALSLVSILILFWWDKTPLKKLKYLPSSLFVVVFGVLVNELLFKKFSFWTIEPTHLVTLPALDFNKLSSYIHLPGWSDFSNYRIYTIAFTIAVVASLETLLNLEAVQKIDPLKRIAPASDELVAQGIGNITASFLGGLPLTSVIVRSSVNIDAGNATRMSAILHGFFMLTAVLLLTQVMNLIPLASLAAILIMTGYKLAKISLFKEMYRKGWNQFIPFSVTITAIIFTDLLMGIVIGLGVSIFFLLRNNFVKPFTIGRDKMPVGDVLRFELSDEVPFFNKSLIKNTLWRLPKNSKVVIDASYSEFIDEDVLEIIDEFKTTVAPERHIQLNILGLKDKYQKDVIQFKNVLDKETQQKLSPADILEILKAGNQRFVAGKASLKNYRHQVNATSEGQSPMAVVLACIDSRTSPEIVFDAGIGDLLIIRIAGNIADPSIIGSIEIAVKKIGAKLIVVMGHSNCGAVQLAAKQPAENNIRFVTSKIDKAILQTGLTHAEVDITDQVLMEKITKANAQNTIAEIMESSPGLKKRYLEKEIGIVAAYYDTASGKVHFEGLANISPVSEEETAFLTI